MDDRLSAGDPLRVGYVPGVQPDKWLRRWRDRVTAAGGPGVVATCTGAPLDSLDRGDGPGRFDVVFVREPDDAPRSAPPELLRIPLYTETMAVLAERGHELAAFDELDVGDLEGETWLDPVDPIAATPDEVAAAVDLVAANVGLLVLPQPCARHLSRKDVVVRPLTGVPATRIGVAWATEREGDALVDEFVGIVRGRTANSSRGEAEPARGDRTGRRSARRGGDAVSRGAAPRRGRGRSGGSGRRPRRG